VTSRLGEEEGKRKQFTATTRMGGGRGRLLRKAIIAAKAADKGKNSKSGGVQHAKKSGRQLQEGRRKGFLRKEEAGNYSAQHQLGGYEGEKHTPKFNI